MKHFVKCGYWKQDDLVIKNVMKYVGSQKLRTVITKQKTIRLMEKEEKSDDYSTLIYKKELHPKDLVGLYSKTYHSKYF